MSNIYICSPHWLIEINKLISITLENSGYLTHLPAELCKEENIIGDSVGIRHRCIDAIENSDIIVVNIDNYGMDSSWEIGYAEKAGKKIIGLSLDPQELNTPRITKPQTAWDHWMHGWKEHTIVHGFNYIAEFLETNSIYLSIPIKYETISSVIKENIEPHVKKLFTPLDILRNDFNDNKKETWYHARHRCISAIEDSETVIVYLDNYGMDSSWEIGYAEKAGKKIIGLSLDPQELNTPRITKPQTAWDHWMHGWKEHTVVYQLDVLTISLDRLKASNPE